MPFYEGSAHPNDDRDVPQQRERVSWHRDLRVVTSKRVPEVHLGCPGRNADEVRMDMCARVPGPLPRDLLLYLHMVPSVYLQTASLPSRSPGLGRTGPALHF